MFMCSGSWHMSVYVAVLYSCLELNGVKSVEGLVVHLSIVKTDIETISIIMNLTLVVCFTLPQQNLWLKNCAWHPREVGIRGRNTAHRNCHKSWTRRMRRGQIFGVGLVRVWVTNGPSSSANKSGTSENTLVLFLLLTKCTPCRDCLKRNLNNQGKRPVWTESHAYILVQKFIPDFYVL